MTLAAEKPPTRGSFQRKSRLRATPAHPATGLRPLHDVLPQRPALALARCSAPSSPRSLALGREETDGGVGGPRRTVSRNMLSSLRRALE